MSWGSRRIAGVTYDLRHLDAFDLTVTPLHQGARTYVVRVSFGAHTFTRDLDPADTPDLRFMDGATARCFCVQRHGYSLHLPEIMRASVDGRAYFGNKDMRYLLLERLPGMNAPYVVAFKIARAKDRLHDPTMFVVSAHERPGLPPNLPAIRVGTLVSLTVQGKPILRPKK